MLRLEDEVTLFDITTRLQWLDLIKSMKISILISFKALFKLEIYSLEDAINLEMFLLPIETIICLHEGPLVVMLICSFIFSILFMVLCIISIFLFKILEKLSLSLRISLMFTDNAYVYVYLALLSDWFWSLLIFLL